MDDSSCRDSWCELSLESVTNGNPCRLILLPSEAPFEFRRSSADANLSEVRAALHSFAARRTRRSEVVIASRVIAMAVDCGDDDGVSLLSYIAMTVVVV